MTKILSFFLPQFHEDELNSRWWGSGFTEWVNVKAAKPQFDSHDQPKVPANGYYELETPEQLDKQFREAGAHGIDGLIFYHFWNKGTRVLRRPLDNLLANPDIGGNTEFSLCWANHAWTRSWKNRAGAMDLLMPQEYEQSEKELEGHVEFLTNCFCDSRYTRKDGEPILFIYRPEDIPNLKQFVELLKQRTMKKLKVSCHISGIVTAWQDDWSYLNHVDAATLAQPALSQYAPDDIFGAKLSPVKAMLSPSYFVRGLPNWIKRILYPVQDRFFNKITFMDYDSAWQKLLRQAKCAIKSSSRPIHISTFVDFDNTARYGKRARIFQGFTPENFEFYLGQAKDLAEQNQQSGLLLINAWNEWAEGMYLQSDKTFGNARLEAVKKVAQRANQVGVEH